MSSIHWAGLLAAGYKRISSGLPVRDSGISIDELLTSYSSATALDLHQLPYSA